MLRTYYFLFRNTAKRMFWRNNQRKLYL